MVNGLLLRLSDVFNGQEAITLGEFAPQHLSVIPNEPFEPPTSEEIARAKLKAPAQWFAAIATLEPLLLSLIDSHSTELDSCQGLLLSGPIPVLSHPDLVSHFQSGIFTADVFDHLSLTPLRLLVGQESLANKIPFLLQEFPLFPKDPLATENFCLLLTNHFGLLLVLGEDINGVPAFQFSFEPQVVQKGWQVLRSRLLLSQHQQLPQLDSLVEQFTPPTPDYRLVMEFSRQLLQHLPDLPVLAAKKPRSIETIVDGQEPRQDTEVPQMSPDIELLQALTHEIRTPLTTIRTMTRLLLKRAKLTPEMTKCLEVIDQECTEQINRMELIFRAAELETTPHQEKNVQLVPTSLDQVFQQSIPRWKQQAQRRNVNLDVILPQKLPQVVSDPAMLDQMLTGLMEKFTRSLHTGGNIRVQVTNAGHQIKLQFHSQSTYPNNPLKALGQLLMFQPETGSLSLNLDVTKSLFQSLGCKLTVRQRPQEGEVLTIFLPLGRGKI